MPPAGYQASAVHAIRASANAGLNGAARLLWPRRRPLDAQRVWIYRIGNIGDTACAIPAMHAIRRAYPGAHLTLLTSPGKTGSVGARELLDGVSWIDEIVVYHAEDIATSHGRLELIRDLRARQFYVWIELPAVAASLATQFRNLAVARAVGARWGFGWRYEPRIAAQAQSEAGDFPDEVDRLLPAGRGGGGAGSEAGDFPDEGDGLLALVREAGFAGSGDDFPLELSDSTRETVTGLLDHAGVTAADLPIAFAPGAKLEPNRWPPERFIEVGKSLAARGCRIVILG